MTSTRRNRRTRLFLIAATRHSSPALCMDQRAITPSKSAKRILKIRKRVKSMTKSASMRRITTTRVTQVRTMNNESRASVDMPAPSEDPTSASSEGKIKENENYHLHIDKKMNSGCHVPRKSTNDSIRASPSWVKEVEIERCLLHSWTTSLISQTPS